MKSLKRQNGITLIALVITIIVLLILAGVTIAMVVGDNGIITRSKESKEETKKADELERITLAVVASKINEDGTVDADYLENPELERLKGDVIENTIEKSEDDAFPWTVTGKSGRKYIIAQDGTITKEDGSESGGSGSGGGTVATAAVDSGDYGQYVDIGIDINNDGNTTNDFRIFLNDGDNVYLIATDYLKYDQAPQSATKTLCKNSDYRLSFDYVYNDYTGASNIVGNSKLNGKLSTYHKWVNAHQSSTNSNIRAIAFMLDTEVWTNKFSNDKFEYVIGGPTLEMFVASYNATHTSDADQIGYAENNSNNGYEVKLGSGSLGHEFRGLKTDTDNDLKDLYVITSTSKAVAMWLASPSAGGWDNMLAVHYDGYMRRNWDMNENIGLRPLVSLKSSVQLVDENNDGVYEMK